MKDREAREAIVEICKELSDTKFSLFNTNYEPWDYKVRERNDWKRRITVLEDKLERLMDHFGLVEVKPNCTPKIVSKGGPERDEA